MNIEINDLSKVYRGGVQALNAIDMTISGGMFGLLGPNGAGKTTLMRILAGILRPTNGSIHIGEYDFDTERGRTSVKRMLGYLPQDLGMYPDLSAREFLDYVGILKGMDNRKARRQRVEELLETVSLTNVANRKLKTYSGGMKRRINIGCALMHRPKLLLLDEPTVGIDPQARANILEFVRQLGAEGAAILYTTHYLEEAETLCSRIGIIDHGKLLAEGTLPELRKRLGGDQLFVLEGNLQQANPDNWPGFRERFRIIQKLDHQLVVSSQNSRHPSECLRDLLELPVRVENVTLKRPSLNDVFLQLTGRELRE